MRFSRDFQKGQGVRHRAKNPNDTEDPMMLSEASHTLTYPVTASRDDSSANLHALIPVHAIYTCSCLRFQSSNALRSLTVKFATLTSVLLVRQSCRFPVSNCCTASLVSGLRVDSSTAFHVSDSARRTFDCGMKLADVSE